MVPRLVVLVLVVQLITSSFGQQFERRLSRRIPQKELLIVDNDTGSAESVEDAEKMVGRTSQDQKSLQFAGDAPSVAQAFPVVVQPHRQESPRSEHSNLASSTAAPKRATSTFHGPRRKRVQQQVRPSGQRTEVDIPTVFRPEIPRNKDVRFKDSEVRSATQPPQVQPVVIVPGARVPPSMRRQLRHRTGFQGAQALQRQPQIPRQPEGWSKSNKSKQVNFRSVAAQPNDKSLATQAVELETSTPYMRMTLVRTTVALSNMVSTTPTPFRFQNGPRMNVRVGQKLRVQQPGQVRNNQATLNRGLRQNRGPQIVSPTLQHQQQQDFAAVQSPRRQLQPVQQQPIHRQRVRAQNPAVTPIQRPIRNFQQVRGVQQQRHTALMGQPVQLHTNLTSPAGFRQPSAFQRQKHFPVQPARPLRTMANTTTRGTPSTANNEVQAHQARARPANADSMTAQKFTGKSIAAKSPIDQQKRGQTKRRTRPVEVTRVPLAEVIQIGANLEQNSTGVQKPPSTNLPSRPRNVTAKRVFPGPAIRMTGLMEKTPVSLMNKSIASGPSPVVVKKPMAKQPEAKESVESTTMEADSMSVEDLDKQMETRDFNKLRKDGKNIRKAPIPRKSKHKVSQSEEEVNSSDEIAEEEAEKDEDGKKMQGRHDAEVVNKRVKAMGKVGGLENDDHESLEAKDALESDGNDDVAPTRCHVDEDCAKDRYGRTVCERYGSRRNVGACRSPWPCKTDDDCPTCCRQWNPQSKEKHCGYNFLTMYCGFNNTRFPDVVCPQQDVCQEASNGFSACRIILDERNIENYMTCDFGPKIIKKRAKLG